MPTPGAGHSADFFLEWEERFYQARAVTGKAGTWKPLFLSVHLLGLPSACVLDKFRVWSYMFKPILADWLAFFFFFNVLMFLLAYTNYT